MSCKHEGLGTLAAEMGVGTQIKRLLRGFGPSSTWRIMGLSKYGYKYPKWGYK